jgi:hypothetical protein
VSEDLTSCPTLKVGSFTADGATPDGDGIAYTVQQLDGWWDSPAQSFATVEVAPFGEVVTVARMNGRAISLILVAHLPDGQTPLGAVLCFTAIDTVKAAFAAVYSPVTLEVIEPYVDQSVSVRLVGVVQAQILGPSVAVRFLIQLLAPDPTFL